MGFSRHATRTPDGVFIRVHSVYSRPQPSACGSEELRSKRPPLPGMPSRRLRTRAFRRRSTRINGMKVLSDFFAALASPKKQGGSQAEACATYSAGPGGACFSLPGPLRLPGTKAPQRSLPPLRSIHEPTAATANSRRHQPYNSASLRLGGEDCLPPKQAPRLYSSWITSMGFSRDATRAGYSPASTVTAHTSSTAPPSSPHGK